MGLEAVNELLALFERVERRSSSQLPVDRIRSDLEKIVAEIGHEPRVKPWLVSVVGKIAAGPDPVGGLDALERFVRGYPDKPEMLVRLPVLPRTDEILAAAFSFSRVLANVLVREPELLWWLAEAAVLDRPKSADAYRDEAIQLAECSPNLEACHRELLRWKYRELLRVAVRDVTNRATLEEVTRELSDIAQACVVVASRVAWNEMVERHGEPMADSEVQPDQLAGLCVLGMGKLGGRELNFSSDIDLVFVYDAEGMTTGATPSGRRGHVISNHVFFNKMGERIVRFLGSPLTDGALFRVDMRLRPEGKSGPLARSLESFINYLEQQARDWERVAYLKARVLAGPAPLGERLYRFIGRFVFDTADPARITAEIEKLKLMIDREVLLSESYHREVKRGYGGIREIEFVVAAMQIIYGQTHAALRVRNIFLAIQRLAEVGVLSCDEAEFYLKAYEFLRLVEHRLQMAEETQTHTIPMQGEQLEILARRCHFETVEAFQRKYREVTDGVHERFVKFFARDIEAEARELQEVLVLLDEEAPETEAVAILARYGIGSTDSLRLIRDLARGTREVFISAQGQRFFEQMLPSLLRLIARVPQPQRVLPHFHSFMLAIRGITYYYELIAQHPDILRLLVTLFGSSDSYAEVLCSHPEFFDSILGTRLVQEPSTKEAIAARAREMMGRRGSWERRTIALRRAAKFEQLLVALRHLLGMRPLETILEELSNIADVLLGEAWNLAVERWGARAEPRSEAANAGAPPVTVLALGKYGGREISFFSDLDVVYVWDDISSPAAYSAEDVLFVVDQFVSMVTDNLQEGRLYALDARLRPHGRNAPLVVPLSYYVRYLEEEAQVWELMAFTRSRVVFGDIAVLRRLDEAAENRRRLFSADIIAREARTMRRRLEESVEAATPKDCEFKRSPGGMVDVEFLIQYLLLTEGISPRSLASGSYLQLLQSPPFTDRVAGVHWSELARAYNFYRRLETAVRLIARESAPRLDCKGDRAIAVARALEWESPDLLLQEIRQCSACVRTLFDLYLPG